MTSQQTELLLLLLVQNLIASQFDQPRSLYAIERHWIRMEFSKRMGDDVPPPFDVPDEARYYVRPIR